MRLPIGLTLCAAVAAAGCGGPAQQPPPAAAQPALPTASPPAADLPVADNQDYANWKKFPVGTAVTRKKVVKNSQDAVTETTVVRLVELTDQKAVVEMQITVERSNTPPTVNPAMRLDYPATFRVPPGLTAEQMSLPSLKAKKTGQETVKAVGKEYVATVYEWQDSTEAGPMPTRAWLSGDVPGRMVRLESKVAGVGNSTTEEVVEIKVP
jgi:hypothetical protein